MAKAGQIIIVSILTLICCIPVITIVPALSALYYGTIKTIRRERGYIHKEYFRSFKHCLSKGILFSVIYEVLGGILLFNIYVVWTSNLTYLAIYTVLLILMLMSIMYLVPVLSRFNMKMTDMIKLSLNMSVRHFPTTVLLIVIAAGIVFLQVMVLPVVTVMFIPGLWCYLTTYLIERILKKYMTKVSENSEDDDTDAWYLE